MDAQDIRRRARILEIDAIESLTPDENGVELNEGYEYYVDGSLPQLADSIAKLALELDKDANMGESGGAAFLALITQYYTKLKEEVSN